MTAPVRRQSNEWIPGIATPDSTAESIPLRNREDHGTSIGDNIESFSTLSNTNQLQGGGHVAGNESDTAAESVPPCDGQNLGTAIDDDLESCSTLPSTNQLQDDVHVDGNEPGTTKPPRSCEVLKRWHIESLALVASLACQTGLLVVLFRMEDQPLEDWTAFISLNALVSISSTVSRSLALIPVTSCISQLKWLSILSPQVLRNFDLMDQASRGPSGSTKLLLRVPFRLVSLGAAVTIMSFAMGPFSQQILRFEPRDVEFPKTTASFATSHEYTRMPDFPEWTRPLVTSFDYAMRGAFLNGLYGYGFNTTPEFNCSSTCIWHDTYTTLGFDSECHDVTSETLETKACIGPYNQTVNEYDYTGASTCNMTTPGNVSITTSVSSGYYQTVQFISSNTHADWNPREWTVGEHPWSIEGQSLNTEFLHVAQYQAEQRKTPTGFYNSSVMECTFRLAAWQMSGVSANGSVFDVANRTRVLLGPQGTTNMGRVWQKSSRRVSFNGTGIPPMAIDLWDWMAITSFMLSQLSEIRSVAGPDPHYSDYNGGSPLFVGTYGGISTALDRVARSMTDALRTGPGSDLQYGVLRQSVVFVKVDWLWYLLPGAVEIGTLALLAGTMWTSSRHRSRVPLWKDSSLGLLFHDVKQSSHSDNMLEMSTKIPDENGLKAAAKSLVYMGKR